MKIYIFKFLILFSIFFSAVIPMAAEDFVVVIDAGHGGKDPGTTENECKEKDINLQVALRLGDLLKNNLKGVKVVYTRDKDEYLTLQQRADKANNAKGNIFISIHTNSAAYENPNRTKACGSSTHVLGLSKDEKNMAVTQRENSVIMLEKDYKQKYQGFDPDSDESYIIFEMMQKKNLSRSIYLAQEIQKQLHSVAGRKDNGVHQNGFWVLWATSMPAVLVELDYICNPNSRVFISSESGQNQLAKSIFNAVKTYYEGRNTAMDDEKIDSSSNEDNDKQYAVVGGDSFETKKEIKDEKKNSIRKSDGNAPRRRRSMASKVKSNARDLESVILSPENENSKEIASTGKVENIEPIKDSEQVNTVAKNSKKTNKKPKLNSKKTTTIYRIQLMSSVAQINTDSSYFKDLKGISCVRVDNKYHYFYGESDNLATMEAMLANVKPKFPSAQIVKSNIKTGKNL
jgi:N-acetylmuramoyl-L-alanine amidase